MHLGEGEEEYYTTRSAEAPHTVHTPWEKSQRDRNKHLPNLPNPETSRPTNATHYRNLLMQANFPKASPLEPPNHPLPILVIMILTGQAIKDLQVLAVDISPTQSPPAEHHYASPCSIRTDSDSDCIPMLWWRCIIPGDVDAELGGFSGGDGSLQNACEAEIKTN